ncbi:MAG: hypothetical protein LBF78_08025 [Treponema sp.]|jgi:hypothetical protein|nr:hypothetical protein [Treponema sp.]
MVTVPEMKKDCSACCGLWKKPGDEGFDYIGCFGATETADQVIGHFIGFYGTQSVRGTFSMEKTPDSSGHYPLEGDVIVSEKDYSQISEKNMDVGIITEPSKRFIETAVFVKKT